MKGASIVTVSPSMTPSSTSFWSHASLVASCFVASTTRAIKKNLKQDILSFFNIIYFLYFNSIFKYLTKH